MTKLRSSMQIRNHNKWIIILFLCIISVRASSQNRQCTIKNCLSPLTKQTHPDMSISSMGKIRTDFKKNKDLTTMLNVRMIPCSFLLERYQLGNRFHLSVGKGKRGLDSLLSIRIDNKTAYFILKQNGLEIKFLGYRIFNNEITVFFKLKSIQCEILFGANIANSVFLLQYDEM